MERLTFRAANQEDLPYLVELRLATMAAHEAVAGVARSSEQTLARVLAGFDQARILVRDGQPIGLLKVLREGSAWRILQFQIEPTHQRGGIGTLVLRDLLAEAKTTGASLRLAVLKTNPARHLYERLGFVTVGENEHSFEMQASP